LSYIKSNYLIILIDILLLLLLVLPYSESFWGGPFNETHEWRPNFVYSNEELLTFYIPLATLYVLYQLISWPKLKKYVLYLCIVISTLYSLNALASLMIAMQDFIPSWGNLLIVGLAPLTWLLLVKDKLRIKQLLKSAKDTNEI